MNLYAKGGTAYFARAVSYPHKMFMELNTGGCGEVGGETFSRACTYAIVHTQAHFTPFFGETDWKESCWLRWPIEGAARLASYGVWLFAERGAT